MSSKGEGYSSGSGQELRHSQVIFVLRKKTNLPRNVFRRDEALWLMCCAHGKCGMAAGSGMKSNSSPGRGRGICSALKKDDFMVTLRSCLAARRTGGVTWGKCFCENFGLIALPCSGCWCTVLQGVTRTRRCCAGGGTSTLSWPRGAGVALNGQNPQLQMSGCAVSHQCANSNFY